ncbi:hypothetical protein EB796_008460 [Bugula neritina]|uniref:Uncharacterized protein n=1 Tax=Bugula neritina TaxID=10212 RepID=A0A7J7K3P0_BUGNE|nr:hypothetical protein EB796_008460 [Bugula neritina]
MRSTSPVCRHQLCGHVTILCLQTLLVLKNIKVSIFLHLLFVIIFIYIYAIKCYLAKLYKINYNINENYMV